MFYCSLFYWVINNCFLRLSPCFETLQTEYEIGEHVQSDLVFRMFLIVTCLQGFTSQNPKLNCANTFIKYVRSFTVFA